jgi:hypothetical protein
MVYIELIACGSRDVIKWNRYTVHELLTIRREVGRNRSGTVLSTEKVPRDEHKDGIAIAGKTVSGGYNRKLGGITGLNR